MSTPAENSARRSPRAAAANPTCSVPQCSTEALRSLSLSEARKAFPSIPEGRRAHLCRDHYREWKKATKKERELRRLGM